MDYIVGENRFNPVALGLAQSHGPAHNAREFPVVALAGDQAISVVLYFVNPLRADRRLCRSGRDARLEKAERLPFGGGDTPQQDTENRRQWAVGKMNQFGRKKAMRKLEDRFVIVRGDGGGRS